MIVLLLIVAATTIAYLFLKLKYQYWERKGVKGPKPTLLVGNLGKTFFFKESPGIVYTKIYNAYKREDIIGAYRGTTPVLVLVDPEAIKEVTVRSFNHFHDNDLYVDKKIDPIFGGNPFALKGEEWKTVRAKLTPGFTSGKMKWLYPLLEETGANLVKFIENTPEMSNGQGYEAKELSIRFTLNNVASCAFGIEGRCFEEENSKFRQISKDFFAPDAWGAFLFTVAISFPKISNYIPFRVVPKKVEQKLFNMVCETLKYRDENNVVRNDFLHILNEIKKTSNDYFTELDVTAHAAGFFVDGSETSSVVMSLTLFELAANPDAQAILRNEINTVYEENDDKLPYEVLQSLPYLDAVINEALRLRPPLFSLHKVCTETFTYAPENRRTPVVIEEGTPIVIPVHALHHNPQQFENPDAYKPERFLGENKNKLTKYTFMPFGEGPRSCLGKRFGVLQIKVGIASIVRNFEISVNKKTQLPIEYEPFNSFATPIGGLWLDFKKIS